VYSQAFVDALRFLSVDAVDAAQSGHPGMPLGMAEIAAVLWKGFLKHNPNNPHWFNRDRFVLSNGHGSALYYALLHLTGYPLTREDLKQFRQLHSKTPGHPECTETPGVETTTGPLGQGFANAVGMAIAEKVLAAQFNRPDYTLVDHYTYVFVGDGCLMEGISHEAASFAGTLGLNKLIAIYDDNAISIDGPVTSWFRDDTTQRFKAYHWHVIEGVDGHDTHAIERAIDEAKNQQDKPSLIICKTTIGYGSLLAGTEKVHGAPLDKADIAQLREKRGWHYPPFEVPEEIYKAWDARASGANLEQQWLSLCQAYQKTYPEDYTEFLRRANGDLPDHWLPKSVEFIELCRKQAKPMATRKASQHCIEFFASIQPELLGGSADLSGSNNTKWQDAIQITHEHALGNYLHYGVRELGMSAIMNGLALHGGFIPFGGTFLVFSDYARSAVRLSALMQKRVIYIYSHDSIGLGEDGPTHQPVEHAAMLRMTPQMHVWRPADLTETAVAWQQALLKHYGPSSILLSRQTLPVLPHAHVPCEMIAQGAYVLYEPPEALDAIIIATGSEVQIGLEAAMYFKTQDIHVRVVSMPCAEQFLQADSAYQSSVLPNHIRTRVAIEALASAYWYRFVGLDGAVIGLDRFGISAPAEDIYADLGITVEKVIAELRQLIKNN
jgi:transketolase